MNWIFLAARLPVSTLLTIGAIGGLIIVAWSYGRWRDGGRGTDAGSHQALYLEFCNQKIDFRAANEG